MSRGKGLINIDHSVKDPEYRYKMSPLITKVEGRGNGIKTVLMNVDEVSKQLHTVPQWLTKFFGIEKGALSRFDASRGDGVGIVNGVHSSEDLQVTLRKYVTEFILCPKCRLPELEVRVSSRKSMVAQRCSACDYQGKNPSSHKVKTYMISHPPPKSKIIGRLGGGKKKRKKKDKSKLLTEGKEDEGEAVWSVSTDDTAVRKRKAKGLEAMGAPKSAARARDIAGITDRDSPVGVLRMFLLTGKRQVTEIFAELQRIQMAYGLDETGRMKVTMEALLVPTSEEDFSKSLAANGALFKLLIADEGNATRFFSCLEEVICRRNHGLLLPKAYHIFFGLFKSKIVGTAEIIEWYDSPADSAWLVEKDEAQSLRDSAKVFAEFLKEEMADDSSEDDDSDSEESEYESEGESDDEEADEKKQD